MSDVETKEVRQDKFVDIERVLNSKNKNILKWTPKFVLNWFKRFLHQEEINEIMTRVGHLGPFEFLDGVLSGFNIEVKTIGLEHIPKTGGVIIAANHPLGGVDGMAFMQAVGRVRPDIQFLVNDMLYEFQALRPLFVPVNKVGNNPREATRIIEEAYKKDVAILIFPSGLVSRMQKEGVRDLEWKRSFILKSTRYKKDIIPVHIGGQNSKRFYRFSNWRQRLGIKANLEMAFLSDEMFRQTNKTLTIRFGKPVPYQTFDKSKSPAEWAAWMREKTYALPNEM